MQDKYFLAFSDINDLRVKYEKLNTFHQQRMDLFLGELDKKNIGYRFIDGMAAIDVTPLSREDIETIKGIFSSIDEKLNIDSFYASKGVFKNLQTPTKE
jgi:hypothetical protein